MGSEDEVRADKVGSGHVVFIGLYGSRGEAQVRR